MGLYLVPDLLLKNHSARLCLSRLVRRCPALDAVVALGTSLTSQVGFMKCETLKCEMESTCYEDPTMAGLPCSPLCGHFLSQRQGLRGLLSSTAFGQRRALPSLPFRELKASAMALMSEPLRKAVCSLQHNAMFRSLQGAQHLQCSFPGVRTLEYLWELVAKAAPSRLLPR